MASYRVRFEGPPALALGVATALADADGIELMSSQPPVPLDGRMVALDITVEGALIAVAGAVDRIRGGLPAGASITVTDG